MAASILANRQETKGSPKGWLAALSMVLGILASSVVLRVWPELSPLPSAAHSLFLMQPPGLAYVPFDTVIPRYVPVDGPRRVGRPAGPTTMSSTSTSDTEARSDVPAAPEEPTAVALQSDARDGVPVTAIEFRRVAFVPMVGPALAAESLASVRQASTEPEPSDAVPQPGALGRAMLAAGRGIATGVKLTGSSIRAVF